MLQTYEEALFWIHSRLRLGIKPGLMRMEWMLDRLNNPERKLTAIHIAGTNGKGSTVSYLRNMLQVAGYRVGTFTSPYFEVFNERISVNGRPIDNGDILSLAQVIQPLALELENTELGPPSEFEIITAMAIYYFGTHEEIDVVLFETGLGGRLDSTNVIDPILSIITNIGFDHMNLLGETLPEIASEKAGIIKGNIPLITSVEQSEALEVIIEKATTLHAQMYRKDKEYQIINQQPVLDGEVFSLRTPFQTFDDLKITMMGEHQVKNAALAVMAVNYLQSQSLFELTNDHIQEGLLQTRWIGRFEQLCNDPTIIIDGAHNPEGINSLVKTLSSRYSTKKIQIIFSALRDKKLADMLIPLESVADSITFTSFDFPRVFTAKELYEMSTIHNKSYDEDWKSCIDTSLHKISEDEILIVTGSLYFLSDARPYIVKLTENVEKYS
ncbi:bifunctional folylpolyglutamate synthase/dihydrofolate synthase [Cytobacillus sp. S13-E01]|uniref:bifunctional folylpolyglutamate synthase/dihydrofolate synthase n=1 Tax=Cytobacillus sp. S13-E01 TaxID=3031326 RepID=UPI0023D8251D|nr:folylpolyglutamate synthase/dihydrofolate synthase family protein [Cytobacillus sp. S13-E01]MDF0726748.1 bifunctional folylpolyglutamate synthase/dihydrofolate synthase [Cytobacillus sp. S13-E01]